MLKRVAVNEAILFADSVAQNPCIRHLMEEALDTGLLVPENSQMVNRVVNRKQANSG